MIRSSSLEPVIVDFGLSTNVDLPEYLFFRCGTPGYVAPEIIKLTQSVHLEPTCDMFSLGAIFHVLLTNRPLFPGIKYDEVYRANKQFQYDFESDNYKDISDKAIDLMKKALILVPEQRITAEDALKHPYFDT
jgi:serine/threonine protein kinase